MGSRHSVWRILTGDCRERLAELDAGSVQTCVTSPPYFGLRDYGHDGQIGMEPTPDEFVAELVSVFREVRRVLADDGTVWLNLGDSYGTGAGRNDTDDRNLVDRRHRLLLSTGDERPTDSRTAESRQKIATSHASPFFVCGQEL